MSTQLINQAIIEFESQVKHAYQGMQRLRDTCRLETGVVGSTVRFPKMGKGMAKPRVTQTMVPLMNTTHSTRSLSITNWIASEFTDIFDQQKTNVNEQQELVKTVTGAVGRRLDQLVIDALDAATSALALVDTNVGGAASGLNIAKLRRASEQMDEVGEVENDTKYLAASYRGRAQLLSETPVTSSDFNTVKALVNGELNTFMGFAFKWIGIRDEGGLKKTAAIRSAYAWRPDAVGLGIGLEKMETSYQELYTSRLINFSLAAGAVVIDDQGYVDIEYTE